MDDNIFVAVSKTFTFQAHCHTRKTGKQQVRGSVWELSRQYICFGGANVLEYRAARC